MNKIRTNEQQLEDKIKELKTENTELAKKLKEFGNHKIELWKMIDKLKKELRATEKERDRR